MTNKIKSAKGTYAISASLGFLGAVDVLFMVFYTLGIYYTLSAIPPVGSMFLQVHLSAILVTISATMLMYGSYLMLKTKGCGGGVVNLLAGTLIPVPSYIYFAYFSQPRLLGWINPFGWALLAPAIISGITSIFFSRVRGK